MMEPLASPRRALRDHYDVIVVGSGYGGAIAASRLSRAGRSVCVLERGAERQPGSYPNSVSTLLEDVQFDTPAGRIGSATALFDIRYNKDVDVVVGCGLGGTSLINAGICLRPDPHVFAAACWPAELQAPGVLDPYFQRAHDMLRPTATPAALLASAKTQALQDAAAKRGAAAAPVEILVNFDRLAGDQNHCGVEQFPCVGCGDCVSGCNYGAKSTLIMNYLPDAKAHGAQIFTGIRVRRVEKLASGWCVHGETADDAGTNVSLRAGIVVLAAGTLGSTEILLRSRDSGLAVSTRIGSRFSSNGDMIGFAYNTDRVVHSVGLGERPVDPAHPVGPCSTVMLDGRRGADLGAGVVMEDGAIPGGLSPLLAPALAGGAKLLGSGPSPGLWDALKRRAREVEAVLDGQAVGAVANTLFMLVMAYDDSAGRMRLDGDRLTVDWPGLGRQERFAQASARMAEVAGALGGTYLQDPLWSGVTGHSLVSGHPLGGCPMADGPAGGVVNHKGQVFDADAEGIAVHDGLYVMDGSMVPSALGVNPLFTISALAERCCAELLGDA